MVNERSVTVAVDLDYALTQLLPAAAEWHNSEKSASITADSLTSADWVTTLAGEGQTPSEWLTQLFTSTTKISAVDGARASLKPLRKYFTLFAITDRSRAVEAQTREWLDANFSGVFDKVLFVDVESGKDDVASRKKELLREFRVKIAMSADSDSLGKIAESVEHTVTVGSVPWAKPNGSAKTIVAEDWAKAKDVLEKLATDMQLPAAAKATNGPKLARYTDDLVTVSTRKPAGFYASIVKTKFSVQKQNSVRLEATEGAIATAVQAAELVKAQSSAHVSKISTRYVNRRFHNTSGGKTAAIEIVLTKVAA